MGDPAGAYRRIVDVMMSMISCLKNHRCPAGSRQAARTGAGGLHAIPGRPAVVPECKADGSVATPVRVVPLARPAAYCWQVPYGSGFGLSTTTRWSKFATRSITSITSCPTRAILSYAMYCGSSVS